MCDAYCVRNNLKGKVERNLEAVKYTNNSISDYLDEGVQRVEIVSRGSKLMKRMKLPTLYIRLCEGKLMKSKVYYVILQSQSGQFRREIPAIMYTNPKAVWSTQTAELLPLCVGLDYKRSNCAAFTPMLLSADLKRMFRRGRIFNVKVLVGGRLVDRFETEPWNKQDIKLSATRMMITDIIYQDIRGMPIDMMKRVVPSTDNKRVSVSSVSSTSTESSTSGSLKRSLSAQYPDLKFTGLTASGGSSFAKWFKHVPPDVYVDRNFECDHGTMLGRDRFANSDTFFKYLNL